MTAFAAEDEHVGQRMEFRNAYGGVLCAAVIQPGLLATCTPDHAFVDSETFIQIVVADTDGEAVTDYSDEFAIRLPLAPPTAQLDSYDTKRKEAHLSGTAPEGADYVQVSSDAGLYRVPVDPATRQWSDVKKVVDADNPVAASVFNGRVGSRTEVWLPGASFAPPPVATEVTDRRATLRVTGLPRWSAVVRDAAGNKVGGGMFVNGAPVDITLAIPSHESRYTVVRVKADGHTSAATEVVFHEGVGRDTLEAPRIGGVVASSQRVSIPVAAAKGAVITVRDVDGKVVGVRVAGSSGSAQVPIASSGTRGADPSVYTAAQTLDGAVSPSTLFTLPGAE